MEEIWMPVKGWKDGFYDGLYEVSNLGRWKMLPRVLLCRGGQRVAKEKITTGTNSNGYRTVTMKKNRIKFQIDLHRLVATAFISNPNNLPEVNHKDRNRSNNNIENLEWVTQKDNIRHAFLTGVVMPKGEERSTAKLTDEKVREIRVKYTRWTNSYNKLAKEYGVSSSVIRNIVKRKKWKHVI